MLMGDVRGQTISFWWGKYWVLDGAAYGEISWIGFLNWITGICETFEIIMFNWVSFFRIWTLVSLVLKPNEAKHLFIINVLFLFLIFSSVSVLWKNTAYMKNVELFKKLDFRFFLYYTFAFWPEVILELCYSNERKVVKRSLHENLKSLSRPNFPTYFL